MNKADLLAFREDVETVIRERRSLGEYNADSKHMLFLLRNVTLLIDHAIDKYPKNERKK